LVYGVGTRLITSEGHSALDGVYKLVAMQEDGTWIPAIKISESAGKTPNPGLKCIWRIYDPRDKADADLISLEDEDPTELDPLILHHPTKHTAFRSIRQKEISHIEPLLVEILRDGDLIYDLPSIEQMRERRQADLEKLDPGVRRIMNPHIYHVSVTKRLWDLKQQLIQDIKSNDHKPSSPN
jgi:nicotinate phosphoribosyltransferase